MQGRRRRSPTSCNKCLTPPPVSSVTRGSLTAVCPHYSTMSFTGWTCQKELCTSWLSWCIVVCMVKHLGTSPTISLHAASDVAIPGAVSVPRTDNNVPRCRLDTYGRRAFAIAGRLSWNSLPDELKDPARGSDSFKQFLKTILFGFY